MAEKRFVTVETDGGITYYGRMLGLIDDAEFHKIITDRKMQNRTYSVETKHLEDVVDEYIELGGLRLVVALKKIDDKDIIEKWLFISEKLDMISYISTDKKVGIQGMKDEYLIITEDTE